jgi:hypothetical protein
MKGLDDSTLVVAGDYESAVARKLFNESTKSRLNIEFAFA